MNDSTPCRRCARLPGCPILGEGEVFHWDRVIDENTNPGVCDQFSPMGEQESQVREMMYSVLGNGYLRGLHILPRDALQDAREGDDEMIEVPDFAAMVREGMSVEERTDQFLYETDDSGTQFVTDQRGAKIPRGELPVRKYASDPEGPVGPPSSDTIAYWDFDKVLNTLLKAEKRLGWIMGPKKTKKTNKKTEAPEKPAAAPKEKKEEENEMTNKPRIMLRRQGKPTTPPPAQEEKQDKTPGKVKAKTRGAGKAKATNGANGATAHAAEAAPKETGGGGLSTKDVEKIVKAQVAPLEKKLDAILKAIGEGPGGRSVADTVRDGLTAHHDATQTKISNLFFALCELTGNADENLQFPFLEDGDGRDKRQNLVLDSEGEPTDVISFYLDGGAAETGATEEEEEEEEASDEEEEEEEEEGED